MRHAELIVEQLGLEHANAVSTPGIASLVAGPAEGDEDEDEEELLSPIEATAFRTIAARCNYLQPDRSDIHYAFKEVCRRMSKPTPKAWEMLKRIGRYLKGKPRQVWRYDRQQEQAVIEVHADANWAVCRRPRK